MRKITGMYLIERFDRFGVKKKTKTAEHFMSAKAKAAKYEAKEEGNSAVIMRVLYNTIENWDDNEPA